MHYEREAPSTEFSMSTEFLQFETYGTNRKNITENTGDLPNKDRLVHS